MAWMRILLLCLLLFLSTTSYLHYRTGILDWGWRLLTFQICTVIWQPMTVLFLNYNKQAIHVSQGQRSLIHLLPLFQGQLINHLHYLKIILIQLIYQTGVRLCRIMKITINVGRYQQIPLIWRIKLCVHLHGVNFYFEIIDSKMRVLFQCLAILLCFNINPSIQGIIQYASDINYT